MTTYFQQLKALFPFFIIIFTLVTVILSISYNRNHFITAIFSIVGFIASFFSIFFLSAIIPIDVTFLFHIDNFSILYIGMIIVSSISTCVFAYPSLVKYSFNKEEFYLLVLISTLGAMLLVISNHMASFFLNIELISLPMFGLIAYFSCKKKSLESAFKYIILSGVSSSFLLIGIAWIYSISGDLSFASIHKVLNIISLNEKLVIFFGIGMVLFSLFFKLSIFPLHLWTPDIYQGTPSLVLSFFSTVGKIATFSVLLHFLSQVSIQNNKMLYFLLSFLAIFSILIGNLMAIFQNNLKRLFGYLSISHMGYLFVILLTLNNNYLLSLESSGIYLFSYLFSNIVFFGIINLISNSDNKNNVHLISSYRGFFWSEPILSSILTLVFLSLAGIPMTLGFIGKFYILSLIIKENLWIVGISFLTGTILGLYCYLRIIINLYLSEPISFDKNINTLHNWVYTPSGVVILISGIILLILGVYPNPLINLVKLTILV